MKQPQVDWSRRRRGSSLLPALRDSLVRLVLQDWLLRPALPADLQPEVDQVLQVVLPLAVQGRAEAVPAPDLSPAVAVLRLPD